MTDVAIRLHAIVLVTERKQLRRPLHKSKEERVVRVFIYQKDATAKHSTLRGGKLEEMIIDMSIQIMFYGLFLVSHMSRNTMSPPPLNHANYDVFHEFHPKYMMCYSSNHSMYLYTRTGRESVETHFSFTMHSHSFHPFESEFFLSGRLLA